MKKKITTFITLLILLGGGGYWLATPEKGERVVKVSGSVVLPLTHTPVSGVDLSVGDTSIRTKDSGGFVFPEVSVETGIRLTHPEILRAIVILPSGGSAEEEAMNILFDTALYNTLITIADREARGNVHAVYNHLTLQIQEKLSPEEFSRFYEVIFLEDDITNQEIVVREIRRTLDYQNEQFDLRFKNVIEFELVNDNQTKWYRFVYEESEEGSLWRLIL